MKGSTLGDDSREFLTLFLKEVRDVLRDRRAAFFTFVFPLLLYPALFVGVAQFQKHSSSADTRSVVRLGLHGDYDAFFNLIEEADDVEAVLGVPPEDRFLEDEEFDVLIDFRSPASEAGETAVAIRFDGALPTSSEGKKRVEKILRRYRHSIIGRRLGERGVSLPSTRLLTLEPVDIAGAREKADLWLARFLPAILVLLFLTGGAFAAMDLVAGEKERGTLETLLVHPVSARKIGVAKFMVILICSIGAVIQNLLGMALASHFQPESGILSEMSLPSWPVLARAGVAVVPLAVMTSGILLVISSLSRSFREAQAYLAPVMIFGLLPALVAAMPNVELDPVTAWIPVANICLVLRDTLAGGVDDAVLVLAFMSASTYAALVLRWSAALASKEEILLGMESDPLSFEARGQRRARRVIVFGAVVLLVVYYAGTLLQSQDGLGPHWGLAVTLWGVVLIPALLFPLKQGIPLAEAWALRPASLRDLALTLLAVPAVGTLMLAYLAFQDSVLPLPEEMGRSMQEALQGSSLHPLAVILLFVLSPAVCEEILWRGTFQGELEREDRPRKTILLVALFFGLFHLSIYRFVPTALLGGGLALLRWRTGSLLPPVLFHAGYNGLLIFGLARWMEDEVRREVLVHPATLAVSAGVLFLVVRNLGRGAAGHSGQDP